MNVEGRRRAVKSFILTFLVTASFATVGTSDITDEVVSWMEEAQAQGECSTYIGSFMPIIHLVALKENLMPCEQKKFI